MSFFRKPAMAGAIAGLAFALAGAWYVSKQQAKTPPAAAAVAAAPKPSQPAAKVSREQAVELLMALPELKRWADRIEQRSGGKLRGALIEYDPNPRDVNGKPHYQLTFVENGDDSAQALASFLVGYAEGDILVEDDISGELLPLDKWRKAHKE